MKYIASVLIAFLLVISALAQDGSIPSCEQEALDNFITQYQELATENIDTATPDTWFNLAMFFNQSENAIRKLCNGLFYTNTTNPGGIIGPIELEGTIYEISAQINGISSFEVISVTGDCDDDRVTMFEGGTESQVFRFDNCEALIEVDSNGEDWVLVINRIR